MIKNPDNNHVMGSKIERHLPLVSLCGAAIPLIGLIISISFQNGILFEKSGKLLVAYSALITYLQVTFEIRTDKASHDFKTSAVDILLMKGSTLSEADKIYQGAEKRRQNIVHEARLRIARVVLVLAATGEIVAVFGATIAAAAIGLRSSLSSWT